MRGNLQGGSGKLVEGKDVLTVANCQPNRSSSLQHGTNYGLHISARINPQGLQRSNHG